MTGSANPDQPVLPVARVYVDTGLAHLDRPFDYAVPAELSDDAQPGVRVKVRFAGKDRSGFILERVADSDSGRALASLRTVVSAEKVLTPQVAALCEAVAARYAGTRGDVLRTAVPPRHARVEAEVPKASPDRTPLPALSIDSWSGIDGGDGFLHAIAAGRAVGTASVTLPPDAGSSSGWPRMLADLAVAAQQRDRGALLIVPDHRDVHRLDAALTELLGPGRHVALSAELGPAERYRRFLAVLRGQVSVVVGTRAAALAPVRDLAVVACLDDGDDNLNEPRAPGWHVREVLLRRASMEGAVAVLASYSTSCERAQLVGSGWARPLRVDRSTVRERAPRVLVAGADDALARDPRAATSRVPRQALQILRDGLATGSPVLVQVPRRGYAPALACANCGERATCPHCTGPLAQRSGVRRDAPVPTLTCRWCGRGVASWSCPTCHGTRVWAPVVGSERTAEELGRAFPQVLVRDSAGDRVLASVPDEPALVVGTTGAEPVAAAGYAAAVLLDGWALLDRDDLRAGEEALRRWMGAAALVRPAGDGGRVLVVADPAARAVQALVAWDPDTFAEREYADRLDARLPPGARLATLEGSPIAVQDLVDASQLPAPVEIVGPVPVPPDRRAVAAASARATDGSKKTEVDDATLSVRMIIRTPVSQGAALAAALRSGAAVRSAAKAAGSVRVRLDPVPLA